MKRCGNIAQERHDRRVKWLKQGERCLMRPKWSYHRRPQMPHQGVGTESRRQWKTFEQFKAGA